MKTNRKFESEKKVGSLTLQERIIAMLVILIIAVIASLSTQAQTSVKRGENGAYTKLLPDSLNYSPTSDYFMDSKGTKFTVYQTKNGKYFVFRTSKKTGKTRREYLKLIN